MTATTPFPIMFTDKLYSGISVKVQVTVLLLSMVRVMGSVEPERSPDQPEKDQPGETAVVRVTTEPWVNW